MANNNKVAILVLADTETHTDHGRLTNAMETTKEFKEAGDEVQLIFDGAGTKWVAELSKKENRFNQFFNSLKEQGDNNTTGKPPSIVACKFCANAFGVEAKVRESGTKLADEFEGHPSLRKLVSQGYQIISF